MIRARRLAPPGNVRWEITIVPDSDSGADVSVVLPAAQNCADQGAICTDDGRMLSEMVTLTVAGPNGAATPAVGPDLLTAEFMNIPDTHTPAEPFTLRVVFSEPVGTGYKTLWFHAFEVSGARITSAARVVKGKSDVWDITVHPVSFPNPADVSVTLPASEDCDARGGVCTADRRPLSNRLAVTIAAAPVPADWTPPPVYLTFDDGPDPSKTPRVLDILARHNARATFFVQGRSAESHPEIIDRIVAEGHTVGNHSWGHERLDSLSRQEFDESVGGTQTLLGEQGVPCLRPPWGAVNADNRSWAQALGLEVILWTTAPLLQSRQSFGVDNWSDAIVLEAIPGAVMLLHDTATRDVEALDSALERLSESGLRFEPVCQ